MGVQLLPTVRQTDMNYRSYSGWAYLISNLQGSADGLNCRLLVHMINEMKQSCHIYTKYCILHFSCQGSNISKSFFSRDSAHIPHHPFLASTGQHFLFSDRELWAQTMQLITIETIQFTQFPGVEIRNKTVVMFSYICMSPDKIQWSFTEYLVSLNSYSWDPLGPKVHG